MKILDAADLLAAPPPPMSWAVEGVIPLGAVGDLAGPPGEGKSTLVLDLAISIASGCGSWLGRPCISGSVVLLGGERGDDATLSRDLHRVRQGRHVERSRLMAPSSDGDHPPIWRWSSDGGWELTGWGHIITDWLALTTPALVVLDTHMAVTAGTNQLDNAQQYEFGIELRRWARMIGGPVVLTISHTNQFSAGQALSWRLHYLARAGGNGLPGALRWVAGLSRLRPDDALAKKLGLEKRAEQAWLVALAVSKGNEMPRCRWSPDTPAIFEMLPNGSVVLLDTHKAAAGDVSRYTEKQSRPAWLPGFEPQVSEVCHVPSWL